MDASEPPTRLARHNLPVPRTSFVGRQQALVEVRRLLASTRLLTLTGSGGSGKTRLALRVAEESLRWHPGGVWWIDLAPLAEPGLLPGTVAGVLGLREQPGRSYTDLLRDDLSQRAALLILDNCEHLRTACAELMDALFAAGCAATVLATSREPLGVEGEQVWNVPLMALPEPGASRPIAALQNVEGVRLFLERAQAVSPAFRLHERNVAAVAQICRVLDGLPLAIELAAARTNVLAPQQIAERLDDSMRLLTRAAPASDARHTMLRAAMDWSFDLLSPPEQALFARLAVFAASFALEAVEDVCAGHGLKSEELLDLLASLFEKSLVVAVEQGEEMRYRMLEPIRQYAAERLRTEGDEERWCERHAGYFLALAERAEPELNTPSEARWLDRVEREHDNLRAALAWSAAHGWVATGLRLVSALHRFWDRRGYLSEGQRWVSTFLEHSDPASAPELYVRALNASALLHAAQSNFAAARARFEESLALAYGADYAEGVMGSLIGLGHAHWELGEFPGARAVLEKAVQLCREQQHMHELARALGQLALVHQYQSEAAQARAYYEEALAIDRRLGNLTGVAVTLFNLAMMAAQAGDYTAARLGYQEVVATNRQLENPLRVADALVNLGQLSAEMGDVETAAGSFAEAGQIYRELDDWGDLGYVCAGLGDMAFVAARYSQAEAHYQEALRLFRGAGNQRLIGRALGRLGHLAVRQGRSVEGAGLCAEALTLRRAIGHTAGMIFSLEGGYLELAVAVGRPAVAARLLGAADAARQALARPRMPVEAREIETIRKKLQAQLADEHFPSVWGEGRALTLEQAADYALDSLSRAAVAQPLPELRIFALGPVRVYRRDRLLASADWTYAKARELVLFLLCHPPATRGQVGVELWPDASTAQVHKRFSAALAYARNALGREVEWIRMAGGRYRFDRSQPYWFDVEAFEAGVREAQALLRGGRADDAVRALVDAVNLYQHDFAEDLLEGTWHTARREGLRHTYLEALLALARLHVQAGRDEQAIAVYRRAIAKDAYLEEAHLEVIRAYARLGKRRQALDQYETLRVALIELGAAPSDEIPALIERLRRGDPL